MWKLKVNMDIKEKITHLAKSKAFVYIVLAVAAGVALLVIPSGDADSTDGDAVFSAAEYCAELENKVRSLILELDEVKSCKVAVTLAEGYEYLYASDARITHTYGEDGTIQGDDQEREYIFATTDGNTSTVIIRERMPAVEGVAVVCEGASAVTEQKIISIVSALFNIKSNKISVITQ